MRAILVALLCAVGCGKKDNGAPNEPAAPVPAPVDGQRWTREEAARQLKGKTQDEVKKALGKPDDTLKVGNDSVWFYRSARIVYDPAAEKFVTFTVKFNAGGTCYDVR